MTKIKVEIPEGFEVESFDESSAEVTLRPKPKDVSGIQTLDDLLKENGITPAVFENECKELTRDERAYRIIKLLAKTLNQGWEPDWSTSDEYKYYPWFEMGSSGFRFGVCGGWDSYSGVGSRLCFKTRELCEHASKHFVEVYKDFMIIE
jgi:hypothetical protein